MDGLSRKLLDGLRAQLAAEKLAEGSSMREVSHEHVTLIWAGNVCGRRLRELYATTDLEALESEAIKGLVQRLEDGSVYKPNGSPALFKSANDLRDCLRGEGLTLTVILAGNAEIGIVTVDGAEIVE